jgi:hypothetical protein
MLCKSYGIPLDTCPSRELLDNAMIDTNVLMRKRCAPLNHAHDRYSRVYSVSRWSTLEGSYVDKVNQKSMEYRPPKARCTTTHIKPPTGNYMAVVYKTSVYNGLHNGSSSSNPNNLENLEKSTSAYLDTDRISDNRFSNMQRKIKHDERGPSLVGDSNGESSCGSGNEHKDRDNALYDDRMVEADEKNLKDWKYLIRKISRMIFRNIL